MDQGNRIPNSFHIPNSPASVLGFKQNTIYGDGRHASENLVNIISVNSILVHCNIIHSAYMRGTPVAYNFFPNAAPGQKILEALHNLIYLPATVIYLPVTVIYLPVTVIYLPVTAIYLPVTVIYLPVTVVDFPVTAVYLPVTVVYLPVTNLPSSDCRRHFNFVCVVNGTTRKALGSTWRGIEYTFSSS